ncbi:MAG: CHAT domain-containing protein [Cyanobacteria bacterium J06598_1]
MSDAEQATENRLKSTLNSVLNKLRKHQRSGDYVAAATCGDALPDELKAHPKIAIEQARCSMRQGYIEKAEGLLNAVDTTLASAGEQLILSLEKASLQVLRRIAVIQGLKDAEQAFKTFAAGASPIEQAEAQRVYTRVVLNAAIYKEITVEETRVQSAKLLNVADVLEAAGHLDEGLSARFTYAENHFSGEAQLTALGELAVLAEQAGFAHVAGDVYVRRAERQLIAGGTSADIEADLHRATVAYGQVNHIVGPVDVRRVRSHLAIQRALAGPAEWIECLALYQQLDYPKGALSLLLDLSQLAHDSGDTVLALDYRQQCRTLAKKVGMGMAEDSCQLAWIDLLMRNSQYGAAIESCEAAIASDLPRFSRGNYEQLLSTAYSFVKNSEKSMHHGRQAIALFDELGAEGSTTIAVTRLASDLDGLRTAAGWHEAEQLLIEWIEKDLARQDVVEAVQKQELLAQTYINQLVFSEVENRQPLLEKADDLLKTAEELALTLEKRNQVKRLGAIYQMRGQTRQLANDFAGVEQTWEQARSLYESAGMLMEAANCRYIMGALKLNMANQQLLPHFGDAESHFQACLSFYDQSEMRKQAADTHFMFAQLYTNAAQHPQAQSLALEVRSQMLQAALDHLEAGEFNYDAIRRDFYAGSALEAQQSKQEIIRQSWRLYDLALKILLHVAPDETAAWRWAQRAKARTLADTLGTAAVVPARILAALSQHPASLALFEKERTLAEQLAQARPESKAEVRAALIAVREQMAQDENLSDYLEIRTGVAFDLDDVERTFPTAEDKQCVCIDWVEANGELWLFALRPGGPPVARRLGVRAETMSVFVEQNLSKAAFRSTLRDVPEILEEMTVLVAALEALTKPEELLVFAPTGSMHAIPLHALEVNGQVLIERNPIVYCPSLNVLRQCLARGKTTVAETVPKKVALFGDPEGDRPAAAELVSSLAELYGADCLLQEQVSRVAFLSAIAGKDIVHFQGHAYHDIARPLESHLRLADGKFTARDIFELRGLAADIVTLGACESGANVIDIGDEPLGLIPSFLFAGSRSVLASLWKVNSKATARFMLNFYQALAKNSSENATMVSKARAVQRAMLSLRGDPDFSAPYYWAAFVLHGDWH